MNILDGIEKNHRIDTQIREAEQSWSYYESLKAQYGVFKIGYGPRDFIQQVESRDKNVSSQGMLSFNSD